MLYLALALVMLVGCAADEQPVDVETFNPPSPYAAGAAAPAPVEPAPAAAGTPAPAPVPAPEPQHPAEPQPAAAGMPAPEPQHAAEAGATAVVPPIAAGAGGSAAGVGGSAAGAGAGGSGGSAAGAGGAPSAHAMGATCQTTRYTRSCRDLWVGMKLTWALPGGGYWGCDEPRTQGCAAGNACSVLDVDGTTTEGVCL